MQKVLHILVKLLDGKIASSWVIFFIDLVLVLLSFIAANLIRFNFHLATIVWQSIFFQSIYVILVSAGFYLIFRSHVSIVRHTSLTDTIRVFKAIGFTSLTLFLLSNIEFYWFKNATLSIPLSIIIIFFTNSLFALIFVRILVKLIYHVGFNREKLARTNILIFGAGELGMITRNTLDGKGTMQYKIEGFVDNNSGKVGKTIEGVLVYKPDDITKEFIEKKKISEIIFSIQNITPEKRQQIIDRLIKLGVTVKSVPPVEHWIHGQLKINQIEKVKIEDLLQRDPINLDNPKVKVAIEGRVVMVTGGAGSIGSEIVHQLLTYNPALVVVVDNAETPVFNLKYKLLKEKPENESVLKCIIADVTDKQRMAQVFQQYHPALVYHAAAYKHVPLMEDHPEEALRVNVFGTRNIADLSVEYGVERFVMVSTDKAVRPTNVMGASKRLAEMYCQSLGQSGKIDTKFVTTRFGNVLGSNGSVVKIFRQQIETGGPVTVTHPEITRFFMTIPEACQLVLEASIMGNGSDIFVFDMGEPVKVCELAKKMIRLAGLKPMEDIEIIYSGLRPGEKLYEELLCSSENTMETHHPKIMIAKVDRILNGSVTYLINKMQETLQQNDQYELVKLLKSGIPDYRSNNSKFEKLDQKIAESA